MLYLVVAAGFEEVVETDEVTLDVGIGVGDAVAHAGLCGEVDDDGNVVVGEDALDEGLVGYAALDEGPAFCHTFYLTQALVFEADIVVVGDGVDADDPDVLHVGEQAFHEVAADEAGGTGDQNGFMG